MLLNIWSILTGTSMLYKFSWCFAAVHNPQPFAILILYIHLLSNLCPNVAFEDHAQLCNNKKAYCQNKTLFKLLHQVSKYKCISINFNKIIKNIMNGECHLCTRIHNLNLYFGTYIKGSQIVQKIKILTKEFFNNNCLMFLFHPNQYCLYKPSLTLKPISP